MEKTRTTVWKPALALSIFGGVLFAFASPLQAIEQTEIVATQQALAEQLTAELLGQQVSGAQALTAGVERPPAVIAQERKAALLALMEVAPGAVLRLALPPQVRQVLPAEAQPHLEQDVQLEGSLEVLIEHWPEQPVTRQTLVTTSQRYTLHFAQTPPGLLSGSRVRVHGLALDQHIALTSEKPIPGLTTSLEVLEAALPESLGAQRVIVLLVNFLDKLDQPYSLAAAYDLVFNHTNTYYREVSYGQTWLTGRVAGWYTLPITVGQACPRALIFSEALAAADPDVFFPDYDRILLIFPSIGCQDGVVDTLGTHDIPTPDGVIRASKAWVQVPTVRAVAHELGHNLGIGHANALECGAETLAATRCTTAFYGDRFDVMGTSAQGHFNAVHKDRLAWLTPANVVTVGRSGRYTLSPLELPSIGPQTLRLIKAVDGAGRRTWYSLEYRQRIGLDAALPQSAVLNGALVRLASDGNADTAFLDMTPSSLSYPEGFDVLDGALAVGKTFTDPSGIRITTRSSNPTALTVEVTVPKDTAPPQVEIASPLNGNLLRGTFFVTA
ncbi:MAG: hypothetical protein Q8R78_06340, partial [Candidatus Omnitrophota bacterium]|nr:hypothetical protein [Candidatus Omnitrophota bacterium]